MGILDKLRGKKAEEEIPEFGPGDLNLGADFSGTPPRAPGTPGATTPGLPPLGTTPGATTPGLPNLPPIGLPAPSSLPPLGPPPLPFPMESKPAPLGFPQPSFPSKGIPDETSRKLDMILDKLGNIEERLAYLERALYGQR